MSASACPDFAFPKGRPRKLDKDDRDRLVVTTDRDENTKAKQRAGGRCEVFEVGRGRCMRKDQHTHHMLSGFGRRGKGRSGLAEHKQRVCATCHHEITTHVLRLLVDGDLPKFTDAYERWK